LKPKAARDPVSGFRIRAKYIWCVSVWVSPAGYDKLV
jgi:hypothetical protein